MPSPMLSIPMIIGTALAGLLICSWLSLACAAYVRKHRVPKYPLQSLFTLFMIGYSFAGALRLAQIGFKTAILLWREDQTSIRLEAVTNAAVTQTLSLTDVDMVLFTISSVAIICIASLACMKVFSSSLRDSPRKR